MLKFAYQLENQLSYLQVAAWNINILQSKTKLR